MSDTVKLIIEIPKEAKQAFDKAEYNYLKGGYYDLGGIIGKAIRNGTPLDDVKADMREPKGEKICRCNTCKNNDDELSGECYECIKGIFDHYEAESEEVQPKQTDDSCLDFDFDKVKEILKKDGLDSLIVDHTCEEKQEQTRDEKIIAAIDFAIKATNSQDDYDMGMRNGMRYVKSLIDGKEPQFESRRTDEEIKLGIDLGDEVISDYGAKGVVVGMDTHEDEVLLSLLMRNHKVPQLVQASNYKTKTGRHFPQIVEVLEQMKGEADGK